MYSQDIIFTLGTSGNFIVKDASTTFYTLSQSTGNTSVFRNFELGGVLNSTSTTGVITKNGYSFMHNYGNGNTFTGILSGNFSLTGYNNTGFGSQTLKAITWGFQNTALGCNSMLNNTTGTSNTGLGTATLEKNISGNENTSVGAFSLYSNTQGSYNTSVGVSSMYSNISGTWNTAVGHKSLFSVYDGSNNSAFGYQSLYKNTQGYSNSAMGTNSLYNNTIGANNTAVGNYAMWSNTYGNSNVAISPEALYSNIAGNMNAAVGLSSLFNNTYGNENSAFGPRSLMGNTTGIHNTGVGFESGKTITTGSNNVTLGYDAQVPSATTSNQVRIGNTSVTYAGVQVNWSVTSDRRWKSNILTSNLGLGFISRLRPVSYTRNNDESGKTEYGFIAQEVEEALNDEGAKNIGMLTVDDNGMYEMRYNDLLAPMVKSIQELSDKNSELVSRNQLLEERLSKFEVTQNRLLVKLAELEQMQKDVKLTEKVMREDK